MLNFILIIVCFLCMAIGYLAATEIGKIDKCIDKSYTSRINRFLSKKYSGKKS